MEFLVVSKTKLKVILDKKETEEYHLQDFSSSESRELRRRLRDILAIAKERVGFESEGARLLVSYYPTRLSGAELFVTVVSADSAAETVYYIFPRLEELTRACRAVGDTPRESEVSLLPSGEYCLALTYPEGALDPALEFSSPVPKKRIATLLERSRILASPDAVALFARL